MALANSNINMYFEIFRTGLIFGLLTTACGIIGTLLGNLLAQCFLYGWLGAWSKTKRAHLVAAGCGALISTPCLVVVFVFGHSSELLTWIMVGVSITGLCFNWSLNVEVFNVSSKRKKRIIKNIHFFSKLWLQRGGVLHFHTLL